jgi:hypothetical protein
MDSISNPAKYLESVPPTYANGSPFLGYKLSGGQTFTSYSPSTDMNAYLQAITGMSGWKQRQLLQSKHGTEILNKAANGQLSDSISNMAFPGYHSRASCQQDTDCGDNQVCYTFNEQVSGPMQGPTCSPTVYPEIKLGNEFNNGKPLRQYSNYCTSDTDCQGVDKYTGNPKKGMVCNKQYKGPGVFERTGMCQVEYESGGLRYFLKQPPGWAIPLQTELKECNSQGDCGDTGIDGWSRCVSGSYDGKKYCTWPGQTHTPDPKELYKLDSPSNIVTKSGPAPTGLARFK